MELVRVVDGAVDGSIGKAESHGLLLASGTVFLPPNILGLPWGRLTLVNRARDVSAMLVTDAARAPSPR
jgi:hypothetical protein